MRRMCDPGYVYTPISAERREKLRESHRKRLGNKRGHHQLYGIQVPDNILPAVRKFIAPLRRDGTDPITITIVIRLLIQQRWLLADRPARIRIAAAICG